MGSAHLQCFKSPTGGSDEHPGSELLVSELVRENGKVGKKYKAEVPLLVLLQCWSILCNLLLTSALPWCQIRIRICHSSVMKINISSLTFLEKTLGIKTKEFGKAKNILSFQICLIRK